MVRGVAFSGLEAQLLSESEYRRLDSIVNKFAGCGVQKSTPGGWTNVVSSDARRRCV